MDEYEYVLPFLKSFRPREKVDFALRPTRTLHGRLPTMSRSGILCTRLEHVASDVHSIGADVNFRMA